MRIAAFQVDATPPLGSPVAYTPARKILAPLTARGIVILTDQPPVVLCAVDWIGIGNGGQDVWKQNLADAAGTTPDRVAVHTLHQHDGPRCDFTAEGILSHYGWGGLFYDNTFARQTIDRTAEAVKNALKNPQPVTHIGTGKAKVEKVASNRRILGPDGKVAIIRYSKSSDPAAIAAPEGIIDPFLRMVSFWNGDKPLAVLTFYAVHPQSYYGQGDVNPEFIGMARAIREAALPGVPHIHFNGAGGDVAAGKYNDGSEKMRPVLANRVVEGMKQAWEATTRFPVEGNTVEWRSKPVILPLSEHLKAEPLLATLKTEKDDPRKCLNAACNLAWLQRTEAGHAIDFTCLSIGPVCVLCMPGELFVEYQLAAQSMRPDSFVCMAAYGNYGPSYVGMKKTYSQGGYEARPQNALVAPQVEEVIMQAMNELLHGK